jgi:transposase-like protein
VLAVRERALRALYVGHMGRPSKLTPRVHDQLVTLVGAGVPKNSAARYLGLDPGTVSRWLAAGRSACERCDVDLNARTTEEDLAQSVGPENVAVARLYFALRRASAQPALRGARAFQRAIQEGDWRAAKNYLVRRFPQRPWTPAPRPDPTPQEPPTGRPTKLTPQVHDELVELVSAGNFRVDAAHAVGINESTLHRWLQRGRAHYERVEDEWAAASADESDQGSDGQDSDLAEVVGEREWPFVRLYRDVSQAEGAVEVQTVQAWTAATETDWRAAAAFLAYRWPERWAPGQRGSVPDALSCPVPSPSTDDDPGVSDQRTYEVIKILEEDVVIFPQEPPKRPPSSSGLLSSRASAWPVGPSVRDRNMTSSRFAFLAAHDASRGNMVQPAGCTKGPPILGDRTRAEISPRLAKPRNSPSAD